MENVNSVEQLESLCSNTPLQLFYCDKHFSCATSFQWIPKYQWAIQLECSSCNRKWHVCKSCKIRAKMVTDRQLQIHHKKYHCESVQKRRSAVTTEKNLSARRNTFLAPQEPMLSHGIGSSGCSANPSLPQQLTTVIPPLPLPIHNDDVPAYDNEDDLDSTNASINNNVFPVQLGKDTGSYHEHSILKTDWGLNRQSQIFLKTYKKKECARVFSWSSTFPPPQCRWVFAKRNHSTLLALCFPAAKGDAQTSISGIQSSKRISYILGLPKP